MVGFIKNFFSGIAAFFTGLFSSKKPLENQSNSPKTKKESGFFMQLDEAEDTDNKATSAKPASSQTAQPKPPEPTKAATFAAAPAPAAAKAEPAKVEAKKPEPAKVEPAKAEPAKKPEPVAASNNGSVNNNGKAAPSTEGTTFAPQYLNAVSSSSSRRRPGANMNSFLDLARQVKTPNA